MIFVFDGSRRRPVWNGYFRGTRVGLEPCPRIVMSSPELLYFVPGPCLPSVRGSALHEKESKITVHC